MSKWLRWLYVLWAIFTFGVVFWKGILSDDNLTHVGIIVFFFLTLLVYSSRKEKPIENNKRFFILRCVVNAAIVEGFYMITAPVLSSLRITAGMTVGHMVQNYLVDLAFTLPSYIFIFYVIWRLIKKYEYTPWQYAILMALGQAFGDGSRTFFFNPALLIFLPYVMINYHAMNVVPFLAVRNNLQSEGRNGFWKWASPIIFVSLAYLASGLVIYTAAAIFKLK